MAWLEVGVGGMSAWICVTEISQVQGLNKRVGCATEMYIKIKHAHIL